MFVGLFVCKTVSVSAFGYEHESTFLRIPGTYMYVVCTPYVWPYVIYLISQKFILVIITRCQMNKVKQGFGL